jgi:hypothetical protein
VHAHHKLQVRSGGKVHESQASALVRTLEGAL